MTQRVRKAGLGYQDSLTPVCRFSGLISSVLDLFVIGTDIYMDRYFPLNCSEEHPDPVNGPFNFRHRTKPYVALPSGSLGIFPLAYVLLPPRWRLACTT